MAINKRLFFLSLGILIIISKITFCSAEDEFNQGIRSDSSYVNGSIGIRIDLTNKYIMATDDEISAIMGLTSQIYSEDEFGSRIMDISKITTIYDMLAVNPNDGSAIVLTAEKPLLPETTEEEYVSAYQYNITTLYNITDFYQNKISLCGQDWDLLGYIIDSDVDNPVIIYTYMTKIGDRFVGIIISGNSYDSIDDAASLISCYSN